MSRRSTLFLSTCRAVGGHTDLSQPEEDPLVGYSDAQAREIRDEVDHYEKVRQEVKLASGDYVDMKMFEPAMRRLLDTYIRAEESETISAFDDLTLVELIVDRGADALDYKAYLARIVELTRKVRRPETGAYPLPVNSPARRALFDT